MASHMVEQAEKFSDPGMTSSRSLAWRAPSDMSVAHFRSWLRTTRKRWGIRPADLAKRAGVVVTHYTDWERGTYATNASSRLGRDSMDALHRALGEMLIEQATNLILNIRDRHRLPSENDLTAIRLGRTAGRLTLPSAVPPEWLASL